MGRPVTFTPKIGETICVRVADGESLNRVCQDKKMPHRATVYRWLLSDDPVVGDFRDKYTRACDLRAETVFEDTLEISDDGRNDWMEREDPKNPGYDLNGEHIQRSRLRVETRKWFASKLNPKKYGERLMVDAKVDHNVSGLSDTDLLAELARLRGAGTSDPEGT